MGAETLGQLPATVQLAFGATSFHGPVTPFTGHKAPYINRRCYKYVQCKKNKPYEKLHEIQTVLSVTSSTLSNKIH